MTEAALPVQGSPAASNVARILEALRAASPPLIFGVRLWASVCLALYIAFWLELNNPYWAGTSAAIVCQPHLGASLRKGWYRLIGTLVGAVVSVLLTACFPQDRVLFLGALALWGAACAFAATLLRNFASYSAALAGYTVAIVAGDLLGATGGVNADAAFLLAVNRAVEICIGIISAGIVLAGTDFGGARRRLAGLFAAISSEITSRFAGTLAVAGANFDDTQEVRRGLTRRVIALDPAVDEAFGESSQLRYYSPVLQTAVDGLFTALAGWRAAAVHLSHFSADQARKEADGVLQSMPAELRSAPEDGDPGSASGVGPAYWLADPVGLRRICAAARRRLLALPMETPSRRLLADQAANLLGGMTQALNGLALLMADPAHPVPRRGRRRLRVPDWLPALVSAGRAFVAIGAVALFWIVTTWPSGAATISFTAIIVLLLGPQADQAYRAGVVFLLGSLLNVVLTATIAFAALPGTGAETFAAFSLIIGVCLVPIGALLAHARRPWEIAMATAMTITFMPLLAPTNQMVYNTVQFYNGTLAIVAGIGVALLSFRLLPPLSPAYRTHRLLALTLRDLRRLTTGRIPRTPQDWHGRMSSRLSALPDQAEPLQRSQLLAALLVGTEIVKLRRIVRRMNLGSELDAALEALRRGNIALAATRLNGLDDILAARPGTAALRGRCSILAMREALTQHAGYFGAGESG